MTTDAHGYYAALGVMPSASSAVIRAAYRALAKEYHPDSSNVTDGGAQFRFLTEAYEVLSDSSRRADYDSLGVERPSQEPKERAVINPIECDHCGKVTAQPRRVAFWRVTSFVLGTERSPIQRVYCAKCAASEQLKSTIWTSLLGWWGFPWGPVWTLSCGFKNAFGGERDSQVDEALLWQNAVAFAMQGQGQLAVGLANAVRKSEDAELAQKAADLIRFCGERGVDTNVSLKDAWQKSIGRTALSVTILFALPAAAAAAYLYSDMASTSPIETADSTSWLGAPVAPSGGFKPDETLTTTNVTEVEEPPIALCQSLPANGAILADNRPTSDEGHALVIENGTRGDAIVKVRDAGTGNAVVSFFVRQGQSAELSAIPDGMYKFQYAFGALGEDCENFARLDSAGEFPDVETFATKYEDTYDGTRIVRGKLSYTLYAMPGGNVMPNSISAESFNR